MNPISLASGVVPEFGPVETIRAALAGGFDQVGRRWRIRACRCLMSR